jgi:predicted phage terminase large subunit-like protein
MNKRQAIEELAKRKARKDFWSFCLYMNYDIFKIREKEFKPIADYLTDLIVNGKSGRLSIAMPPRWGKSFFSSHFICFSILFDINNSIIRASYSQTISGDLHQTTRSLLETKEFKNLFGSVEYEKNTENIIKLKGAKRHNLLATSVGGTTTGFGANILISDDLYKDHIEANSETINKKTITWYHSAFTSRQDGKAKIEIMIGTKWRVGELSETLEKSNDQYFDKIFKIKALDNNDKSTNELVLSTKFLIERRSIQHKSIFNSMYQQEPIEVKDALIKSTDIKYISFYEPSNYRYRLMVVDIADKGTDRTTAMIVDIYDNKIIVVDLLTDPNDLDHTKPRIIETALTYEPTHFLIESNNNSYFARLVAKELKNYGINAKTFSTTRNKEQKIYMNSSIIKTFLFLETTDPEYNLFIRNICKYDVELGNKQHDDEIDVAAMVVDFKIELMGE